jgi:hypothetical protein
MKKFRTILLAALSAVSFAADAAINSSSVPPAPLLGDDSYPTRDNLFMGN